MRILFLFISIIIVSCASQSVFTKEGVVKHTIRFYDRVTQQYTNEDLFADITVWYKKELYIQEIKTIETWDANGVRTRETPIAYYLFMDGNSKSFYHYSSFSDTAKIIDKYTLPDSSGIRGVGGWPFYRNWELHITGSINTLADTLIDHLAFKRVKIPIESNGFLVTIIAYTRCDRMDTVFQFDKNLGKKLGCPVTRIDFLPSSIDPRPLSKEIKFLRDSLTKEELKVFDAWEENIKKYPASK